MDEDLLKATHSIGFAVGDLQAALRQANAVQAILILDAIEQAAALKLRIERLASAVKEE